MFIKKPDEIKPSEITDENIYKNRRKFIKDSAKLAVTAAALSSQTGRSLAADLTEDSLANPGSSGYQTLQDEITPFEKATIYNNFYEFGTGKRDPEKHSKNFKPLPWTITVDGECEKPGTYAIEDVIKPLKLEERIYRLRCVEAWSMVIPWVGIPLGDLLKQYQPTSRAKYVAFETIFRPEEMPGQRRPILKWPYIEGLRIDEAMHPLTIFAVGMYGRILPNQSGAPIRLVVPWKYGFKSIKSVVRISFTEQEPPTSWNISAGDEYGFYANVNPKVDHPRWSQAKERRIGDFLKRETLMFNGYSEEVASLYTDLDLRKYF